MKAYKILLIVFFAPVLFSCAKIADLVPPTEARVITLEKDYYIRRESENLWRNSLVGFRSGEYALVGSNEKGDFYLGKRPSLLFLHADDVEYYLNGGELTPAFASKNQFPRTINNGGFLVTKTDAGYKLTMFYINEPVATGMESGGLIGYAGIQMAKGSIEYWPSFEFDADLRKSIESQL